MKLLVASCKWQVRQANQSARFCPTFNLQPSTCSKRGAFTLIEMLVVIAILGILAALVVPALKNLNKSNVTVSATRQLLDDVGRARQLAMANRTTVYMVFVPTNFWLKMTPQELAMPDTTNLIDKQLTSYTFISYGQVGDQPGQHQWHYLDSWRSLPDGTFIATGKFAVTPLTNYIFDSVANVKYTIPPFNYTNTIPFPTATNDVLPTPHNYLPYIAFNYLGQLTDNGANMAGSPEYIPLERGSISFPHDPNKMPVIPSSPLTANDITETPPGNSTNSAYNLVEIDPLTGRATLHFQKLP